MKIHLTKPIIVSLTILSIITAVHCHKGADSSGKGGPAGRVMLQFPVETQPVQKRLVTYAVNAVGSVEAFEVVQVTARVAGAVDKVNFTEGNRVEAGRILAEIEPERYRLAVESAKAAVEKSSAAREDAQAGLKRRQQVIEKNPGLIPGEEIETWKTKLRAAESDVEVTRSLLNQAELNLRDALVRAPVAGIVQTRSVQTGQYVQPGAVLATMVRRDPLLLRFRVPEQDAAQLKGGIKALFRVKGENRPYSSIIINVGAAADLSTRMVTVTARVDDPNRDQLRPGTFAEITVPVGSSLEVSVIPQIAVRPSERGFLAYTVENGQAREKIVILGMRTVDGLVEVRDGLKPGDILVIRGAEALSDGAPVIETPPAAPKPGNDSGKAAETGTPK